MALGPGRVTAVGDPTVESVDGPEQVVDGHPLGLGGPVEHETEIHG
jgi:hypothetical protein